MIGNRVNTSLPQGIACYGCIDSIITDNVLTTLPGARFRTYLRVLDGRNNIVEQQQHRPRRRPPSHHPAALSRLSIATACRARNPACWAQCSSALPCWAARCAGGAQAQMQPQEPAHVGQHRRAAAKGF